METETKKEAVEKPAEVPAKDVGVGAAALPVARPGAVNVPITNPNLPPAPPPTGPVGALIQVDTQLKQFLGFAQQSSQALQSIQQNQVVMNAYNAAFPQSFTDPLSTLSTTINLLLSQLPGNAATVESVSAQVASLQTQIAALQAKLIQTNPGVTVTKSPTPMTTVNPGTTTTTTTTTSTSSSSTGWIIGGGILAILAVGGVVYATRRKRR